MSLKILEKLISVGLDAKIVVEVAAIISDLIAEKAKLTAEIAILLASEERDEARRAGQRERTRRCRARNVTVTLRNVTSRDTPKRKRNRGDWREDQEFVEWYGIFPRHVAPAAAWKAWRSVLNNKLETPEGLIAGARRYASEMTGTEAQYIKMPATWLNGGCWTDGRSPNDAVLEDNEKRLREMDRQETERRRLARAEKDRRTQEEHRQTVNGRDH